MKGVAAISAVVLVLASGCGGNSKQDQACGQAKSSMTDFAAEARVLTARHDASGVAQTFTDDQLQAFSSAMAKAALPLPTDSQLYRELTELAGVVTLRSQSLGTIDNDIASIQKTCGFHVLGN